MPRRPSLALGLLLVAVPLAGCGSEDPELIPQTRASALTSTIDEIQSACDDNDTAKAKAAVQAANQQVSELPRRVDTELKRNIRDWLSHIDDRIERDCKADETPTPSPSPTETPTPSPTETTTTPPTDTTGSDSGGTGAPQP